MHSEIIPNFVSIGEWTTRSGVSRSRTYELLASGELKARKVGRRTLIDLHAGLTWLNEQPAPKIALPLAKHERSEML